MRPTQLVPVDRDFDDVDANKTVMGRVRREERMNETAPTCSEPLLKMAERCDVQWCDEVVVILMKRYLNKK